MDHLSLRFPSFLEGLGDDGAGCEREGADGADGAE
jgi:hypothetical protein